MDNDFTSRNVIVKYVSYGEVYSTRPTSMDLGFWLWKHLARFYEHPAALYRNEVLICYNKKWSDYVSNT